MGKPAATSRCAIREPRYPSPMNPKRLRVNFLSGSIRSPIKCSEEFATRPEQLHLPCQLAMKRESFAFHRQKPMSYDRAARACRGNVKVDILPTLARHAPLITAEEWAECSLHERAR